MLLIISLVNTVSRSPDIVMGHVRYCQISSVEHCSTIYTPSCSNVHCQYLYQLTDAPLHIWDNHCRVETTKSQFQIQKPEMVEPFYHQESHPYPKSLWKTVDITNVFQLV
jgi:hypothetical protein